MRPDGRASTERLAATGFEFPIINYKRRSGQRQRYIWGSTYRTDGMDVLRVDAERGEIKHWGLPGYGFGEPVFVGRPGATAEDDGVLLAVGSSAKKAVLAVLDASTLEPRALAHTDLPIPLGFHGSFGAEPRTSALSQE